LYHEAEWTPFQTPYFSENLVVLGIERGTSGSIARNSEITLSYKYYISRHYPSSCFYLKTQRFGDWILSPSSGKTYPVSGNRD
jgi:hypothetical protein